MDDPRKAEPILQYFTYDEFLPEKTLEVRRPFLKLAVDINNLPRCAERAVALRKLLEAQDAALRALRFVDYSTK
jgi:hypothetical protein